MILKRQLLQEIGGEWRPQQNRHCALRENGQHFVLIVPIKELHSSGIGQFLFHEYLASFVHDVDILALCAYCQVGGIMAPAGDWRVTAVKLLPEGENLLAGSHIKSQI